MLLQPKLSVKVSQRQVLTPGLVQMVNVLALNKLELREMINTEINENPVLEEVDESGASLEERSERESTLEQGATDDTEKAERKDDPFDQIDFGSYFQDYLDPGFKTASNFEEYDKPSFEHFLSAPSTLTDHLVWQLGSMTLSPQTSVAAELVIGNLDDDGYLVASDEELATTLLEMKPPVYIDPIPFERGKRLSHAHDEHGEAAITVEEQSSTAQTYTSEHHATALHVVVAAREMVNQLDPIGVGARDLRECLLIQIAARRRDMEELDGELGEAGEVFETASHIVTNCLALLQKKDMRELTKSCGKSPERVQEAVELIRALDPKPGRRYNRSETQLIEPDVAFVKRDDEYVVVMNEEDIPTLRLNREYRKMLRQKDTDKETKDYVKERFRSAIQLLRNIEQRKSTIVRTCDVIVRRQQEFLEKGVEALRPMMIKEVAEEIGVHPSTVSRAVANKYVHTQQGVFELRFFFSEGVNGPEGGELPLVLLKRKVKKLIEDEDPRHPLTDDQITAELQKQGIQVTRRTVAKYREDLQIPSTHQRRVR